MKVLILNQYVPPDPSPTAGLVAEMTELLLAGGHQPICLGSGTSYGMRRRGLARWLHELGCWVRLLVSGLAAPRAGAVVVMTSPPCLLVAGALVAGWHRARLVHWVMDLYPETAVALGECGPGMGRLISRVMSPSYARCARVVALDDDMAAVLEKRYGVEAAVLPPWPPDQAIPVDVGPLGSGRRTWMYSGNLGRAHDWETLLAAQGMLEQSGLAWDLVFQGDGAGYEQARVAAEQAGLRHCQFRSYAEPERLVAGLLEADVLVATRRPALRGLLWPSKLGLLQVLPRPVVWVGEADGAVSRFLKERGGSACFAAGDARGLADWLAVLPAEPGVRGGDLGTVRQQARGRWTDLMANALK